MDFSRNKGFMVSKPQSNKNFFTAYFLETAPLTIIVIAISYFRVLPKKGMPEIRHPPSKVYIMHAVTDMLSIVS